MVDVSTESNIGSITITGVQRATSVTAISGSQQGSSISATSDTAQYWSKMSQRYAEESQESSLEAKDWANKLGSTVDGEEYSSKHYAQITQETATNAVADITSTKDGALTEITTAQELALTDISATQSSALSDISASQAETLVKISDAKIDVLNEINSSVEGYKSSALDVIEAKSTEEQAVIVAIKDDVLNSTNEASDYKEEAKYWAEKAKDNSGIYYDEIGEQDISVSILETGYVTNETLNETIGDISTVLDDILGGV